MKKINKNLDSVGKSTFVEFYDLFKNSTVQEIKKEFFKLNLWNSNNSVNTKASVGKSIFKNENEKLALKIIISSNNTTEYTVKKAISLFKKYYPNEEIINIWFSRPEFVFGEEIINNLFSSYEIIPQYQVLSYRIDWYIPELNLAIEFDEKHHNNIKVLDEVRQKQIEKALKCKFLRYTYKK